MMKKEFHTKSNYLNKINSLLENKTKIARILFSILAVIVFTAITVVSSEAETFKFKYTNGEKYRILSTVKEDVYINGWFNNYAEIVNRISVEVKDVKNGTGSHYTQFMTSENSYDSNGNNGFVWGEEYISYFDRDQYGMYTIGEEYFMPVVRNVPVFPDQDLQPGDVWYEDGYEAYDLRRSFNISKPLPIPFTAEYTYVGLVTKNKKTLHKINVEYTIFYEVPVPKGSKGTYPVTSMGYSYQTIYWDNEKGAIDSYNDEFRIVLELNTGDRVEFRGTSEAEYTEAERISSQETVAKVQKQLEDLNIQNAAVVADEKGITLSIENIQFRADSALLLESEKVKLQKIAEILKMFPDNDLLISGHTALAGTLESCQTLSENRAKAVANYLKQIGVKDEYHVFTQGFGASIPIDDNNTLEGMARNRRVEITIME